jgi:hypothetical protein
MKEKIKEAVSLYRKENKVVENGSAIMLQRLPIEDIEANKKKAREMLDQIPKEILIQYILENVG